MYSCNRCERNFTCKRGWRHHTNERKTVCRKPTHYCDDCNKGFASYQSVWNHKQRCEKAKCVRHDTEFSRLDGAIRKKKAAGKQKRIDINKLVAGSGYKWESGKLIHDSNNQSSADCEFMESADKSIPKD